MITVTAEAKAGSDKVGLYATVPAMSLVFVLLSSLALLVFDHSAVTVEHDFSARLLALAPRGKGVSGQALVALADGRRLWLHCGVQCSRESRVTVESYRGRFSGREFYRLNFIVPGRQNRVHP